MKVAGIIMAHRARQEWAEALSAKTGFPIHYDRRQTPTVDNDHRWKVGAAAWRKLLKTGAEWGVVIQDDALVCRDLLAGCEQIAEQFPDGGLISLYFGTPRPEQKRSQLAAEAAERSELSYAHMRSLNWGVGVMLPLNTVADMLEWASSDPDAVGQNYDYRIGVYYRDVLDWRTFLTWPSLVDHRDDGSLVGHVRPWPRVAQNFIGEDASALDVDWTKKPNVSLNLFEPKKVPYYNPYWPKKLRDQWHEKYGSIA